MREAGRSPAWTQDHPYYGTATRTPLQATHNEPLAKAASTAKRQAEKENKKRTRQEELAAEKRQKLLKSQRLITNAFTRVQP